jgi:hypothetical protein
MVNLEDYLIPLDTVDTAEMFDEWRWLLEKPLRPVALTLFGDWFLADETGAIYHLDVSWGDLTRAASSRADLGRNLNEGENADKWLKVELLRRLSKDRDLSLRAGNVYAFKVSPALGGSEDPSNVFELDLAVVMDLMGQIHRQIKDLPAGTPVRFDLTGWPQDGEPQ